MDPSHADRQSDRGVSPGFQHEIDGIIDDLIVAFGVTVYHLDPDGRAGWTTRAVSLVGLSLHPPQIGLFPRDAG